MNELKPGTLYRLYEGVHRIRLYKNSPDFRKSGFWYYDTSPPLWFIKTDKIPTLTALGNETAFFFLLQEGVCLYINSFSLPHRFERYNFTSSNKSNVFNSMFRKVL